MHSRLSPLIPVVALVVAASSAATARANERHFAFTYESATLPAGTAELEPWVTWRAGRETYYNRFDQRLEFEVGLTNRLQTALYLNFTALTASDGNRRTTELEFAGVSSEWKLRVLDPVADPVGLAFYLELTAAPSEFELEQKVIVDKRWNRVLFAANLVLEQEVETEEEAIVDMMTGTARYEYENALEVVLETDVALAYFLTDRLALGAELRTHTELVEGEHEHTTVFLGPTVSYSSGGYWLALAVQPQLFAIGGHGHGGDPRDLQEHEMVNARFLVGLHL